MHVIAQQWMSLDGFASGDPDEQEIFEHIPDVTESERHNRALLEGIDLVVLGRRTYETFVSVWPTLEHPMADYVNGIPKVVASSTLVHAPWGEHEPARVVADIETFVRDGEGTALVWGSLVLMRALVAADALDELEVLVAPVVLGHGTPLFGPGDAVELEQVDGDVWASGTARLRYRVRTRNKTIPTESVEI